MVAPLTAYFPKEQQLDVPSHIHLVEWLPALEVSQLVDFSIIHGGEGSIQTACYSSKPFIGIELQYEQEINVRFCERFGNAIALSPVKIKTAVLDKAIDQIQTLHYRDKAIEIRESLEKITGVKNAAKIIAERFC